MANTTLQTVFFVGADTTGDVQAMNVGKSDDGSIIYYELETHEIEFGNRAHLKKIANDIGVMAHEAAGSTISAETDLHKYAPIPMEMGGRVNIGENVQIEGHYVTFRWMGTTKESSPILEGIYLENITDLGLTYG